jgi:hypothetical protein
MRSSPTAVALGWASAIATHAQETTRSTTTTTGEEARSVTYTGCLRSGVDPKRDILDTVMPMGRTTTTETTTGTSGATTTTTTYLPVPEASVELQQHLHHPSRSWES